MVVVNQYYKLGPGNTVVSSLAGWDIDYVGSRSILWWNTRGETL